ncbi:MAG: DNRLRE domain-containing protein [Chloroflexi bacterium]|nr:DNRLRE domain-containing protein [Chloroflexota bacterium]
MFKRIFSIVMILGVLVLAFGSASPGRAQEGDPPGQESITIARVEDVYPGPAGSLPYHMTAYNGALYFQADGNDGAGRELWKYTPASGTQRVEDINSAGNSSPSFLTVYENALYFSATGDDGAGLELWKYDPVNGAQRAADIVSGSGSSSPFFLTIYNGALYFSADGNDGAGRELWKYDTVNGATRVADIYSGSVGSFPSELAVYNGELYFQANGNDGAGLELWKYDAANGAQRVEDIYGGLNGSQPKALAVYKNALYFFADGNDGAGREVWKYDPAIGTQRVADICAGSEGSSTLSDSMTVYHGALYFNANGNDGYGQELWKYDPVNGVQRVADIYSGSGDSQPYYLTVYNDALYFSANGNDGKGYELWMYSNTSADAFRSAKAHDGWALESGENTNAGGTLNSSAATFFVGDNAQDKQYRSVLSFDTSSIPDNAVIISVRLKIRRQGLTGTDPFTTHGALVVDIRSGAFGNNNSLQAGDFQAAASKNAIGTIPNSPVNNWYSKTWTSGIFAYINKSGVTQFRLRFQTDDNNDNAADYLKFFSGDTATLAARPQLEIKYYVP